MGNATLSFESGQRFNLERVSTKGLTHLHWQCQELTWVSIPTYFAEKAPPDVKKKMRNLSQKKKWIVEVLKMPLQFDACFAKSKIKDKDKDKDEESDRQSALMIN